MRAAGRDGTKLFSAQYLLYHNMSFSDRPRFISVATHSWVNLEFMLDACLVGFLVQEPS